MAGAGGAARPNRAESADPAVGAVGADRDDLGTPYQPGRPPRRVVSLVPSLTESLAATDPGLLVGATDYCTHPADLDVPRVGGSKWPDLDRVRALAPDLVLANAEENRLSDVDALRSAGVAVWVTGPTTVSGALTSLGRALAACGCPPPTWLERAGQVWAALPDPSSPAGSDDQTGSDDPDGPDGADRPDSLDAPVRATRRLAAVPIWRRPWMVLGEGTFAADVLRRLGVDNVFGSAGARYPKVTLDLIRDSGADLVVLPDEPYLFTADDGPECFAGLDVALVSGRHLTWYGPSLVEAAELLGGQLAAAHRYPAGP